MSALGHLRRRTGAALAATAAIALVLVLPAGTAASANVKHTPVDIQILSVSDFHGQLDPLSGVGGAAVLSSYWNADRAANPNTLLLTAGDAVGATPPLSSFFADRPTIEWMNLAGFTADTFGNHNFDAGLARLQEQIDLAHFDYLSANLRNVQENLTGVAPFGIYEVGGVKIALIGVTNPEAPTLVKPGSFGTIEISEPAAAAQRARAQAVKAGARVFVAFGHLGVTGVDSATGEPTGPLVDFAHAVDGFDFILGDHTDVQYSKVINNALVVQNKSKGATYSKARLTVDPSNGRVISKGVEFVVPRASAVTPDPAVVELLRPYRDQLAAALDGKIGEASALFPRGGSPAVERVGEAAIGNLVADALRRTYGTQLAFTNGGGLRASLPSSYLPADTTLRRTTAGYATGPPFDLVTGDVYTVLPFGNQSLTRTVTGAQLHQILEHSVSAIPAANGRFLQISGFTFTYDAALPVGSRLVSVQLDDGTPIAPDATTYTATTNDFLNAGGDGYTMLADGRGVTRNIMANDLLDHIAAAGTITPVIEGRITRLN